MRSFILAILSFLLGIQGISASESLVKDSEFVPVSGLTCSELVDTVTPFLEAMSPTPYYPIMFDDAVSVGMENKGGATQESAHRDGSTFSQTNHQVHGVMEGDRSVTNGKLIAYARTSTGSVEILSASDLKELSRISFAAGTWIQEMYLNQENQLVLVGQDSEYNSLVPTAKMLPYWYQPDVYTFVHVYSLEKSQSPKLIKSVRFNGSISESRLVGNDLYIVNQMSMHIPYSGEGDEKTNIRNNISVNDFIPKIRESSLDSRGKMITRIRSASTRCQDVSLVLPKSPTLSQGFVPSFTTLMKLNISKPLEKIQTKSLFGALSQVHVSQSSLYVVMNHDKSNASTSCAPNARCLFVPRNADQSTVIHRYDLKKNMQYAYTKIIEGAPLSQYALDEDENGMLRILTMKNGLGEGSSETLLSILSSTGQLVGYLDGLGKGEQFQSARFIGTRLYLVTFEQVDPFFVIDLSHPDKPKVLGELKIPGYSTYLYPYDADRLIGIGYDTFLNQWGGTQNGGIKIDLYNVRDVNKPIQEASLVVGSAGSYAEVLSNPRAFVWNEEKKLLLMPAMVTQSARDPKDPYKNISVFQGILGLSIEPASIKEKFRISHIDRTGAIFSDWKQFCQQYQPDNNGYTEWMSVACRTGGTLDDYLVQNISNYYPLYIDRALYVGDMFYTFSDSFAQMQSFGAPTHTVQKTLFPVVEDGVKVSHDVSVDS